ncbi:hypothetical protein M9H77_36162 [Catharanthus roseus]|uniref:Uncharacterized protein n=1 Tax=Catharanthus roseus TaxID=4058 RepID=A0ACB9ZT78_CATRO|nr:hypothetical protein M9H77_36162 [Catharanthus roseus]
MKELVEVFVPIASNKGSEMQELQQIRKDMTDMKGNMINLSMEHRSRNNIGEHVTSHTQWGYRNFSPYARPYDCGRSSQTLGIASRLLSYNNLKLPLLCGTFGRYDYEAWEQEVESLFYSYGVREEVKFQLVLKSFSYVVNDWWDCNCEYRIRMRLKPIKTWSLMKQALRIRCGVENYEGQGKGQAKVKFMESSMVEESLKTQAMEEKRTVEQGSFNEEQSVIESISTLLEECEYTKSVVSTKESEGKTKENEKVEEKQDDIEKSEETKEEMSSIPFEREKREEMREIRFISSLDLLLKVVMLRELVSSLVLYVVYFMLSLKGSLLGIVICVIFPLFLRFVSHQFEFPYDEKKVLIVDEFLKALFLENINGFQLYHFHLKELKGLLICGKEKSGCLKVLQAHLCDLVKTTFGNGVLKLTLKNLVEKHLVYSIPFIEFLLKDDIF